MGCNNVKSTSVESQFVLARNKMKKKQHENQQTNESTTKEWARERKKEKWNQKENEERKKLDEYVYVRWNKRKNETINGNKNEMKRISKAVGILPWHELKMLCDNRSSFARIYILIFLFFFCTFLFLFLFLFRFTYSYCFIPSLLISKQQEPKKK